ncbi:FtsK/SpoIIIE domain-containing protein [Haloferula sp.]|uniref:FtsK/SpoIIIE domain-containing protein n=1 Tax=Haloferula sp. TaxID=2497595 RepID=UPI003C773CD6
MSEHPTSHLIGEIAYNIAKTKFAPVLSEDDHDGAFLALSYFKPHELKGFIDSAQKDANSFVSLKILFPESTVPGAGIDPQFLTKHSAVNVRAIQRERKVVITCANEEDVKESLGNKNILSKSDLNNDEVAGEIWSGVLLGKQSFTLSEPSQKEFTAFVRAVLKEGDITLHAIAEYLQKVSAGIKDSTLIHQAGIHLPIISLPLFRNCFDGVKATTQTSQWSRELKKHRRNAYYLDKRDGNLKPLDDETLGKSLSIQEDYSIDDPKKLSDEIIQAFRNYIEAYGRGENTEKLLFNHDWIKVKTLFIKEKTTSSSDFAQLTTTALEHDGKALDREEEQLLNSLKKVPRTEGNLASEHVEFFEKHHQSIETFKPKLFKDWEDWVYGKKIECSEFLGGILRCLQIFQKGAGKDEQKYLKIEAVRQFRINDFKGIDKDTCLFFERHFGNIEKHSNGLIRFSKREDATSLMRFYSDEVLDKNKGIAKEKQTNASTKNKRQGFEFKVVLCEIDTNGNEVEHSSKQLIWKFSSNSVLKRERGDIRALIANRMNILSSATVICRGAYDTVGQKGTPLPISLADISTFDGTFGARNEGSFVPAQNNINTAEFDFKAYLADQFEKENIEEAAKDLLTSTFDDFDASYSELIQSFEKDALDLGQVPTMVETYKVLLETVGNLKHQSIRKFLTKIISQIGTVQIDENTKRPTISIVCPWHPLRLEAWKARKDQLFGSIAEILSSKSQSYSDGSQGKLHFEDIEQTVEGSLYPELSLVWHDLEAKLTTATSSVGAYTLHEQPRVNGDARVATDNTTEAVNTIVNEAEEYLRLQPHEKDNLSILLYNCESRELASRIVEQFNKRNQTSSQKGDIPMNCEIILTHQQGSSLQDVYKNLVAQTESEQVLGKSEGFLSKVRISISALTDVKMRPKKGKTPHADIVYCKDLFSSKAKVSWIVADVEAHTSLPEHLFSHRWNRQIPFEEGNHNSSLLLCCPNQTEAGWLYIKTITTPINGGDQSLHWPHRKVLLPAKYLDIDEGAVREIVEDSHQLGVWVVSQDEMLDRRLLEEKQVKVIRYIQSVCRGRNLIVSSKANDTLLRVTLNQRLLSILPDASESDITDLAQSFIDHTNAISGGLILKAARRTNNTSELLGMVLTKFLVTSEIGDQRPVCWCSLDEFSRWLGKPSGDHLADLLVLAPKYKADGSPHLDLIVTEAKYVNSLGLAENKKKSAKQLKDTLKQISRALSSKSPPLDQGLWLARISDMILSRLTNTGGQDSYSPSKWRGFVRKRECSFSVWGYSHVFIHDGDTAIATVGVEVSGTEDVIAQQEIFNAQDTKSLIAYFRGSKFEDTKNLRLRNGHTGFGKAPVRILQDRKPHPQPTPITGPDLTESNEPQTTPVDVCNGGGNSQESQLISAAADPGNPLPVDPNSRDSIQTPELPETTASKTPMEILAERSQSFSGESKEGSQWLEVVVDALKSALRDKGMSSKVSETHPPVITPNAAIVTFKGGPDLTVKKVEDAAPEFLTTYGIDILRVTPGLGIVSVMVTRPERKMLHTAPVFEALLTSSDFDAESEAVMIGVREEDGKPQMLDPFVDPHTLVSGATGSGKSVLLQSMLLYIGLTRSPENTHVHLVDGKSGVDYFGLRELPHLKAGGGAIVTDKQQSAALLEELVEEMESRYKLFEQTGSKDIRAYRKKTGQNLPTIFYLQDEFAEWMLDKEYAESITQSVSSLGIKSRAAGIFMTFGLQRPDNTVMPMQLRSQLGNRLTLKVADKGTAEIATGDKNSGAERLLGKGHMLAKLEGKFVPIQVPFTDPDLDLEPLVRSLVKQYKA